MKKKNKRRIAALRAELALLRRMLAASFQLNISLAKAADVSLAKAAEELKEAKH